MEMNFINAEMKSSVLQAHASFATVRFNVVKSCSAIYVLTGCLEQKGTVGGFQEAI